MNDVSKNGRFTTSQILACIGSSLVIVSFFLPWMTFYTSISGFQIVARGVGSISDIEDILMLVIILLPIVCHILFLNRAFFKEHFSKTLTVIPLATWVVIFIISYIGASSSIEGSLVGAILKGAFDVGLIGTLIGMILSCIACPSKNLIMNEVKEKKPVVSENKFCPNCGTNIESDAEFCPECGTKSD